MDRLDEYQARILLVDIDMGLVNPNALILIIDDEKDSAQALLNILEQAGYGSCTEYSSSATADGNNHLSGLSYDASGNTQTDGNYSYTWDGESQMKSAARLLEFEKAAAFLYPLADGVVNEWRDRLGRIAK